jgi:hypothetical protein
MPIVEPDDQLRHRQVVLRRRARHLAPLAVSSISIRKALMFAPSAALVASFPGVEFDTYVNDPTGNTTGVLGGYPASPSASFGGTSDLIPGTFSVSWHGPLGGATQLGTFEIARLTFPLGALPVVLQGPPSESQSISYTVQPATGGDRRPDPGTRDDRFGRVRFRTARAAPRPSRISGCVVAIGRENARRWTFGPAPRRRNSRPWYSAPLVLWRRHRQFLCSAGFPCPITASTDTWTPPPGITGYQCYDLILLLSPGDRFSIHARVRHATIRGSFFQHTFGTQAPNFGPPSPFLISLAPVLPFDTFLDDNGTFNALGSTDGTNDLPPPGIFGHPPDCGPPGATWC